MAYTTVDDPSAYFQTALFTGNAGTNAITNTGNSDLQPDWVWFKRRDGTSHHVVFDSVRGVTKGVYPNLTNAQDNLSDTVASFNSDGFTMGADTGSGGSFNGNSITMVAWQWKAGTSFTNDASGTGIGSIDSAGSVNQDAGFSICSYTGAGGVITVKHGLSTVPQVIITKNLSDANHWAVFHHKNTSAPQTDFLKLSDNAATTDDGDIWNDTAPTSAIFTAGDHSSSNRSGDPFIAYCFSEKQGYSKFGSYVGNGNADGTFVYTGFKPAWIVRKNASTGSRSWNIYDVKRGINPNGAPVFADTTAAEASGDNIVDLLSNGFKQRATGGGGNTSGDIYVYMAFAENPFVTSTGVPATAR